MFLLSAVFLGFAFGLLALHGQPANLARWSVHWMPLALGGLVIQIIIFSAWWQTAWGSEWFSALLYVAAMALLWGVTLRNLHLPGMPLVSLGVFCNLLVIALNGGHMPTVVEKLRIAGHYERLAALQAGNYYTNSVGLSEATRLPFLGDIFVLPAWFPLTKVFSVGDAIIGAGGFLLASGLVRPRRRPRDMSTSTNKSAPNEA